MSAATRAQRRELRKLMAHVEAVAKQRLREAIEAGLIEGRIEDDGTVVIYDTLAVNPAFASMYIANPLPRIGVATLFSTHPPIAERIRRLEGLDAVLAARTA